MQTLRREKIELRDTRTSIFVLTSALTLFFDQFTKWLVLTTLEPDDRIPIIDGFFSIHVVRNPGGAFGLFPSATAFFVLVSVAIVAIVIFWWARRHENPFPLGLILGGGLGNLIDRLVQPPGPLRGHVVDFLDFAFWPTFNGADTAIVIGVGLLLISGMRNR